MLKTKSFIVPHELQLLKQGRPRHTVSHTAASIVKPQGVLWPPSASYPLSNSTAAAWLFGSSSFPNIR